MFSKLINRSTFSIFYALFTAFLKNLVSHSSSVVTIFRTPSASRLLLNDPSSSYYALLCGIFCPYKEFCQTAGLSSGLSSCLGYIGSFFCSISLQAKDFSLYPFLFSVACCTLWTDFSMVLMVTIEIHFVHFISFTFGVYSHFVSLDWPFARTVNHLVYIFSLDILFHSTHFTFLGFATSRLIAKLLL